MNRRTVLQSAGALATVGLAGCVEGVQEHFGLQGVVPIELHNEAERPYNVQLKARERESGRESYDKGFSIPPGEVVQPPHLKQTPQSFQVLKFEEGNEVESVEEASITPTTELVLIYISEDDLTIELRTTDADENETAADESGDGSETDDSETESETTNESA